MSGCPTAPGLAVLRERLTAEADQVESMADQLIVTGVPAERVGDLAYELGIRLHALETRHASLEQAYMELTAGQRRVRRGLMSDPILELTHELMASWWIYVALFGFAALDGFFPAVPSETLVDHRRRLRRPR